MLSSTASKTFNLLSIGQRGVGKTVFLLGSYIELHGNSQQQRHQQLWFDCQDQQVQENMEMILGYVTQTGKYPPPTMKIAKYNFSLKRHGLGSDQTLSHFCWSDIPGEICNSHNSDFRTMVSTSHGCCVFIDAHALVHDPFYPEAFKGIVEHVMAVASLVCLQGLNYPFALILTKCDLLETNSPSKNQQIQKALQPLTSRLEAVRANYQTFYSFISIVHTEGVPSLNAKGAAIPLLWLVWELNKAYDPNLANSLQSLLRPAGTPDVKKKFSLLKNAQLNLLLLSLAVVSLVAGIGFFSVYGRRPQLQSQNYSDRQPQNIDDALKKLDILRQQGQFDQAVPLMEKIVQQEPDSLDLRLQLARLYELAGQVTKAETTYDQVIAQQNNNLKALIGKALLRQAQGDSKAASALFIQAETAAPSDFKAQVRAMAQNSLRGVKQGEQGK